MNTSIGRLSRLVWALVAAGLSLTSQGALAGTFHSGNRLYDICTASTQVELAYCGGVITGTWDMYLSAFPDQKLVCLPRSATVDQLRATVTRYLRDNPQERSEPASTLIGLALMERFPC